MIIGDDGIGGGDSDFEYDGVGYDEADNGRFSLIASKLAHTCKKRMTLVTKTANNFGFGT